MPSPEVVSVLSQAPIAVILLVAGVYLMKEFGKRDETWRNFFKETAESQHKTMESVSRSHQEAMNGISRQLERLAEQVAKNTAIVVLHDATVRGTNPETIGTTEEIMERLLSGD